ncbi:hypothetical protein ACFQGT_08605 [Natrialbaceae archaeon GCM10025810]
MTPVTDVVLASDASLPPEVTGWGALILGLLVTIAWTIYFYR